MPTPLAEAMPTASRLQLDRVIAPAVAVRSTRVWVPHFVTTPTSRVHPNPNPNPTSSHLLCASQSQAHITIS